MSSTAAKDRAMRRAGEIRAQLGQERQAAVDTRDPLAIGKVGRRYQALTRALEGLEDEAEVDLWSVGLSVGQAAWALGYSPKQVRQMIREGKLPAHKAGNDWRIPLAVLI